MMFQLLLDVHKRHIPVLIYIYIYTHHLLTLYIYQFTKFDSQTSEQVCAQIDNAGIRSSIQPIKGNW